MGTRNKRIVWLDQLKAIAFIFVIIGHLQISKALKSWIYSFHMPLFFFISGFTINIGKIYKAPFVDYFTKNAKRLILPYFWILFILFPIKYIRVNCLSDGNMSTKEQLIGTFISNDLICKMIEPIMYFLVLMFLAKLLLWALIKLSKGRFSFVLLLSALLLPISICTADQPMPLHLNVVPSAVFMMCIGKIMKDFYVLYSDKIKSCSVLKYLLTIAVFFAAGLLLWRYNGRTSMYGNLYGKDFFICILSAVSTSCALALITIKIPKINLLTYFGQNTLLYLGFHYELIKYSDVLFKQYREKAWFIAIATVVIAIVLIPITMILERFQPYVMGVANKEETLAIKIGKYFAVFEATVVFFIAAVKKIANGFLISNIPLLVLTIVVYLALCFLVTKGIDRFCPVLFLQSEKSKEGHSH